MGFFQDSFTGIEQGPSYSIQVGYQKGAAQAGQNLMFNVEHTQGTARKFKFLSIHIIIISIYNYELIIGAGTFLDYVLERELVRSLYRTSTPGQLSCG